MDRKYCKWEPASTSNGPMVSVCVCARKTLLFFFLNLSLTNSRCVRFRCREIRIGFFGAINWKHRLTDGVTRGGRDLECLRRLHFFSSRKRDKKRTSGGAQKTYVPVWALTRLSVTSDVHCHNLKMSRSRRFRGHNSLVFSSVDHRNPIRIDMFT